MSRLDELKEYMLLCNTAPDLSEMPRRTLSDKGICGPTSAHVIEEIHTPFNLAFVAITTGTTAFQNIVGVTHDEIPDRIGASRKALELAGLKAGDHILFTYPPLVNVFPMQALEDYGLEWSFLERSSRDGLILALCEENPRLHGRAVRAANGRTRAVIGESSFLRAALEDAKKLGVLSLMPKELIFIAAGTPLDSALPSTAAECVSGTVHDLYGCQEFGWLTLDGIPLRPDITLIPREDGKYHDLIAGGLPTGDSFPVTDRGHICNADGKIITNSRIRTEPDYEITVLQSTAGSDVTVKRLARSILRIKGKIVKIAPELRVGREKTILSLDRSGDGGSVIIDTPEKTILFDSLLTAQMNYQARSKTDPAWVKER